MSILESILLVVHLLVAVGVCGFVLLQHGKGADMGAAFGSGASGSLFGAGGSANFLSHTTAILAAVFFVTSLGLTWMGSMRSGGPKSVIQQGVMGNVAPAQKAADTPAAPAPAPTSAPADSKSSDVPK